MKKKNKRILSIPLLIWDFEINGFQNQSGSISISRKSNQEIIINPSLLRLIKKEYNPLFKKLKIDENNNQSNLKNVIKSLLKIFGINNPFPEFTNSLYDQFDENSPKFNNSHETKLINNGVFGLYANSKESLISDYVKLDQANLTCHFDFPKDNNETLFTGVALDHSQQRVIRSINQKKNIVINGPPGTGKSKTLTASIVYLLSIIDSISTTNSGESISSLETAIETWNFGISLIQGWNMFGYGCPQSIELTEVLSEYADHVVIVKDNNGLAYLPEWNFNGIGTLSPGYGYQIKVSESIDDFSLCGWYFTDILGY